MPSAFFQGRTLENRDEIPFYVLKFCRLSFTFEALKK
jgi:hypothetical protein